jgi:diaminopimelate epimerase
MLQQKHLSDQIKLQDLAKKLCDRHFGIGGDGIIVSCTAEDPEADLKWIYINSDGSFGEMCGNGMRCFARYVYDRNLVAGNEIIVETLAGLIKPIVLPDGMVKVNMGAPILEPKLIPVSLPNSAQQNSSSAVIDHELEALDKKFLFTPVSMGNPHSIVFLPSQAEFDGFKLTKYGPIVEKHSYFPQKINAEFAFVKTRKHINLQVWERGCGVTLACGTGACATVVAANLKGLVDEGPVMVTLPGGDLVIEWDKTQNIVWMTGPAQSVFLGQVELEV